MACAPRAFQPVEAALSTIYPQWATNADRASTMWVNSLTPYKGHLHAGSVLRRLLDGHR